MAEMEKYVVDRIEINDEIAIEITKENVMDDGTQNKIMMGIDIPHSSAHWKH